MRHPFEKEGSGCQKKQKQKAWKEKITESGISDDMIKENMKNEKGFRGVFISDLLPKKIVRFENGIINLDVSKDGTHCDCYYNDPKYDFVEYFDPFGEYKLENIKLKKSLLLIILEFS